jgi:WD40 repeat protein
LAKTQVVEVTTGRPAGAVLSVRGLLSSRGLILDAAFSPDGVHVAVAVSRSTNLERNAKPGEQAGELWIWDWRRGTRIAKPLPLPSEPRKLDYNPDGRRLAVIGAGGEVSVVDPVSATIVRQWQAHPPHWENNHYVNNGSLRFAPDGASVYTFGTETNSARVWDPASGELRHELKHNAKCHDVQFSRDGQFVVTTGFDDQAIVWNRATGERLAALPHPDWTFQAAFSPDGRQLVTACRDGMARLWNWRDGRLACPAFEHEHEVHAVAFLPDGRHVLSAGDDEVLKVWECHTGKLACPPLALGGPGLGMAVTPDGSRVVAGGFLRSLPVFHLVDWLEPKALADDDLCLWGEIVSGQRVEEGGGVTNLTTEQWLERWEDFHRRHPDSTVTAKGPDAQR